MAHPALSPEFFSPALVDMQDRADGSVLLRSRQPLGPYPASITDVFAAGARSHPERTLVAQRAGGGWRALSWGEAAAQVKTLAGRLAGRGVAGRPIMILSGNSIEHLVLTLAAFAISSPAVPVSVAYSLQSSDHEKLRRIAALIAPAVVFAEDSEAFGPALAAVREACASQEPPATPSWSPATARAAPWRGGSC